MLTSTTQVETVNKDISKAKSETESYAKAAKADALKKVDEFDHKVEEGASKSKSYLSSWFGGK
jgi:truncated hemoglobin YjbI